MNKLQHEDLLVEWSLYEQKEQSLMIDEYLRLNKFEYNEESFLEFLKEKLEIEGYWEKIGLA